MSFPYPAIRPFSVKDVRFVDSTTIGKPAEGALYREHRTYAQGVLETLDAEYEPCAVSEGCEFLQFNFELTKRNQPYGLWTLHNCRVQSEENGIVEIIAWPGPGSPGYPSDEWQEDLYDAMAAIVRKNLKFVDGRELDVIEFDFPTAILKPEQRWDLDNNTVLRDKLLGHKNNNQSDIDYQDVPDPKRGTIPRRFRRKNP